MRYSNNFGIKSFKSSVVLLANNYRRFERSYSFLSLYSSGQGIELELLVPAEEGNIILRNMGSYLSANKA
jgi:hypothetical protein